MNRASEPESHGITPWLTKRHAIEVRMAQSKENLSGDIARVSNYLRSAASRAQHGVIRAGVRTAVWVGALVVLGIAAAFIRRRKRIRITWR
jgi:hypothetical protein